MNIADRSSALPMVSHRPRLVGARRKNASANTGIRFQWLKPLKFLKAFFSGLSLMSVGPAAKNAAVKPVRMPFSASLGVTPAVATANTPRLLTITAYFPLGCGPAHATVNSDMVDGARVLELRLDRPNPDFAFCDLVLVPYTVELSYTPLEQGDLPVRMMTSDGVLVGESFVMTRGDRLDHTQFDVTGQWIDPSAGETGLAFVAEDPRNDTVVGTWNFPDCQGVSRRYSIESVHWKQPDVEAEGAIFETTASSVNAPSPDLAGSPAASTTNQLGLARITFNGLNSAHIFALGFGGNVLFASNLVRTTS